MRTKPLQLSVMAVAALAVFAVAAVLLLSGGNPAQATNAETRTLTPDNSGGGHLLPLATDTTPRTFPPRPPCPGETGNTNSLDTVVDSGHIALFDVWWNPHEGELTNTSCPPTVRHVPASGRTSAQDIRSAASIDIAETVIHIPSSAKVNLNDSNTPYTKEKYPKLWEAEDAENPDGDGDRIVWALPACPPDGTPAAPEDGGLCLSFSAALLDAADWKGPIVYHMDHVHQIDIDKQDPRYVVAYDVTNGRRQLEWSSYDARVATMPVPAGGYERPMWFFTSRGTYEFQVHITGNPQQDSTQMGGRQPIAPEPSVNSDQRTYIIHVGAESDLGVTMPTPTPAPQDPAPGELVTITLTASNAGPDAAPNPKVDVALPEGLEYESHEPTTATFTAIPDGDSSDDEESENSCACDQPEFEPTHT